MKVLRSARWLLSGAVAPPDSRFAGSRAGVFISVGFAPPVLPVYVQPVVPRTRLMWTPGYWGYGPDGYYWVPGAWVPAPYVGALWTPPTGAGRAASTSSMPATGAARGLLRRRELRLRLHGHRLRRRRLAWAEFAYNTAVMHVNRDRHPQHLRGSQHRGAQHHGRDSRVAYSGGPGGINHQPTERGAQLHARAAHGTTAAQRAMSKLPAPTTPATSTPTTASRSMQHSRGL